MEQIGIPPQIGRYKVFIIDDVTMLSTAVSNAFLKTLEEPPSHVIFIPGNNRGASAVSCRQFCRVVRYMIEIKDRFNTVNHLKRVAEKEGIKYEEEALNVICRKG